MSKLYVVPSSSKAMEIGLEAYSSYQSEGFGVHTRSAVMEIGQHLDGLISHKDESKPAFKHSLPPLEDDESAAFEKLKECCEQGQLKGVNPNQEAILVMVVQYLIKLALEKFGK